MTESKAPPKEKKKLHPVHEAVDWSDNLTRLFVRTVAYTVKYSQFLEMTADEFQAHVNLALYDRFSSLSEEAKAEKMKLNPNLLPTIRASEAYRKMREMIEESAKKLSQPQSFEEMAELVEGSVSWENLNLALFGTNVKSKLEAITEFTSRRSAKKGRQEAARTVIVIPDRFESAMRVAADMQRTKALPAAEDIIDAEVLNVPVDSE